MTGVWEGDSSEEVNRIVYSNGMSLEKNVFALCFVVKKS